MGYADELPPMTDEQISTFGEPVIWEQMPCDTITVQTIVDDATSAADPRSSVWAVLSARTSDFKDFLPAAGDRVYLRQLIGRVVLVLAQGDGLIRANVRVEREDFLAT